MWIKDQGFDKILTDGEGLEWSFLLWQDIHGQQHEQKLYFWNADKSITGKMELINDQTIHFRKLKDRMIKLAKDKTYRD